MRSSLKPVSFLVILITAVFSFAENKKDPRVNIISLNINNISLGEALSLIAKKGDFELNYNHDRIPVNRKVSLKVEGLPALSVLKKVLLGTGTRLKITKTGEYIILPEKKPANKKSGSGIKKESTAEVSKKDEDLPLVTATSATIYVNGKLKNEKNPQSTFILTNQELNSVPGSVGSVNRMLNALPGITFSSDINTELIIRGGCPLENGFYIDNIEVPSLNHLSKLGSTGGYYAALNPSIIGFLDFNSGNFSADFGDRLSSIISISLREGNREQVAGDLGLSFALTGGVVEGPLFGGSGSWLASFRVSNLSVLQKINDDLETVPETVDSQVKFTWDIAPGQKLNVLNFFGSGMFQETDPYEIVQLDSRYKHNTLGFNLLSQWSDKLISNTSLSYSILQRSDGEKFNLRNGSGRIWALDDRTEVWNLRNANFLLLNKSNKLDFGFSIKSLSDGLEHKVHQSVPDYTGDVIPQAAEEFLCRGKIYGGYFSYIFTPRQGLSVVLGLRGDYSSMQPGFFLSPRFSFSLGLGKDWALNGGIGVYRQTLPLRYLAHIPSTSKLKQMKAAHYGLGLEYSSEVGTRITLETYWKGYSSLPISPEYPEMLVSDWMLDRSVDNEFFPTGYRLPVNIVDAGTADSRGIELLLQQKLVNNFHGMLSATYFRSRYKDLLGMQHDRMYDNRYAFSIAGGYRPNRFWELSLKGMLMGGSPYTPISVIDSIAAGECVFDASLFNRARYPDYYTFNLRVERHFFLERGRLSVYLDLWNVFNVENVHHYYWNMGSRAKEESQQLGILPILGIDYKF